MNQPQLRQYKGRLYRQSLHLAESMATKMVRDEMRRRSQPRLRSDVSH